MREGPATRCGGCSASPGRSWCSARATKRCGPGATSSRIRCSSTCSSTGPRARSGPPSGSRKSFGWITTAEAIGGIMNAIFSRALVLLLPALLAACASFSAVNPGASARQVETLVGAPASVWKNADGSEVWEYPRGPFGVETYMVTLGPDRAVRAVRQVLSEEYISKLQAGMSREEVRRLVGSPQYVGFSDRTDEEIWSWRYRDWKVRTMDLYVQFDRPTGRLKTVSKFQVDTSDSRHK